MSGDQRQTIRSDKTRNQTVALVRVDAFWSTDFRSAKWLPAALIAGTRPSPGGLRLLGAIHAISPNRDFASTGRFAPTSSRG